jgi:hypothetical protein
VFEWLLWWGCWVFWMEEESTQQTGTSECVLVLFNWVWQVSFNECESNILLNLLSLLCRASGESALHLYYWLPTGTYHKNLMIKNFCFLQKMFCMVAMVFFQVELHFTTNNLFRFLSLRPPLAFDLAANLSPLPDTPNRRLSASYGEGRDGRTDGTGGERYCSHS